MRDTSLIISKKSSGADYNNNLNINPLEDAQLVQYFNLTDRSLNGRDFIIRMNVANELEEIPVNMVEVIKTLNT
jgi:hypothetical protein